MGNPRREKPMSAQCADIFYHLLTICHKSNYFIIVNIFINRHHTVQTDIYRICFIHCKVIIRDTCTQRFVIVGTLICFLHKHVLARFYKTGSMVPGQHPSVRCAPWFVFFKKLPLFWLNILSSMMIKLSVRRVLDIRLYLDYISSKVC